MDQEKIRQHMRGPVVTIRTPFNRDGSIDQVGLRNFIDFSISNGCKTLILTWGDSHFLCLSEAEITELTKVTLEHVAGGALVVSADLSFSTKQAIEFAKHCKKLGSDMHMCVPPDWAASCTVDTLTEHYRQVAEVLPLMINTNIFDVRGEAFGLEVLRVVLEKSDNIAAVKDDIGGSVAQQQCLVVQGRCVMMAGGTKQLHLNMIPFGCESYMSTYLFFYPEIAHRYWGAVEAKDMKTAWDIVNRYDQAYFQFVGSLPGGFDAGLPGTLELFGICKRWRKVSPATPGGEGPGKGPSMVRRGWEKARVNHRLPQVTWKVVELGRKAKMPSGSVELTAYSRRREYAVNRRGHSRGLRYPSCRRPVGSG